MQHFIFAIIKLLSEVKWRSERMPSSDNNGDNIQPVSKNPDQEKVKTTSNILGILQGLYHSSFPSLLAWARATFNAAGNAFFLVNFSFGITRFLLELFALKLSENRNLEEIGSVIFNALKLVFYGFLIFGAAMITGLLNIILLGIFLVLDPFIDFIKWIFYGILMVTTNDPDKREAFYTEFKKHVLGTIIAGVTALCFSLFFLFPVTAPWALATLAVVATVAIVFPLVVGIVDAIRNWWNSEPKEPPQKQVLVEGFEKPSSRNMPTSSLQASHLNQPYTLTFDYHEHIADYQYIALEPLQTKIHQYIQHLTQQVLHTHFEDRLLDTSIRKQNNVEALHLLSDILAQWDTLMRGDLKADRQFGYQFYLEFKDGKTYSRIILPQNEEGEVDIPTARKVVIDLIQQKMKRFEGIFQSPLKYKGETESLVEHALSWINRNKTDIEINKQSEKIADRIKRYLKDQEQDVGRKLKGVSMQEIKESTDLLTRFLNAVNGNDPLSEFDLPMMSDPKAFHNFKAKWQKAYPIMSRSFASLGERAAIFEDICELLDLKQLAQNRSMHFESEEESEGGRASDLPFLS